MKYSKLRELGYGRIYSLIRGFDYWFVSNLLPVPYTEPLEINIDNNISELENVILKKFPPRLRLSKKENKEVYLGRIMVHLDSILYNY